MIFEKPWQCSLDETLQLLEGLTGETNPRISILGIGNELHGDDAAGMAIVRALAPLAHERLQIVAGAHAPENCLGTICNFNPDLVLLIDAVDMGNSPGTIAWLDWQATSGISASTHTMPPYMLGKYLQAMAGCHVALIGIQPASMQMGTGLSSPAQQAVDEVGRQLSASLAKRPRSATA
jgi:hydrogenase 3 maturation protease